MINVVCFNGGRGAAAIIPSLLEVPNVKLTSIVNAYDDGKSTGAIRNYFDMLGPSDIRKVQQLMLSKTDVDYISNNWLFEYRFPKNAKNNATLNILKKEISSKKDIFFGQRFENINLLREIKSYLNTFIVNLILIKKSKNFKSFSFNDCSLMNCIYAGAFIDHGRNIEKASLSIEKLFNLQASVLPNTLENKKLMGIRENGNFLYSEAEIVELRSNISVERIFLLDDYLQKKHFEKLSKKEKLRFLHSHQSYVELTERSSRAISDAHIIIYSPGTQHSSLFPTYLSKGVASSIANNLDAQKIFISNIGADYETPKYFVDDYISSAFKYLTLFDSNRFNMNELFTNVLVNKPKSKDKKRYVQIRSKELRNIPVPIIIDNFESDIEPGKHCGQKLLNKIFALYGSS